MRMSTLGRGSSVAPMWGLICLPLSSSNSKVWSSRARTTFELDLGKGGADAIAWAATKGNIGHRWTLFLVGAVKSGWAESLRILPVVLVPVREEDRVHDARAGRHIIALNLEIRRRSPLADMDRRIEA